MIISLSPHSLARRQAVPTSSAVSSLLWMMLLGLTLLLGSSSISLAAADSPLQWDPSPYTGGNLSVIGSGEITFHWVIDPSNTTLSFALVVPFNTQGWVGFGVGESTSGSMPGADMMILQYDTATMTTPTIGDYYAEGFVTPTLDCRGKEEWALVKTTTNGSLGVFELTRSLKVNDTAYDRDIVLEVNSVKLVFAYGTVSSDLSYHGAKRGVAGVNLAPPLNPKLPLRNEQAVKAAAALNETTHVAQWMMPAGYVIPVAETTYAFTPCYSSPPANGTNYPAYIIGYQSFAQTGNEGFTHHMVAKGYLTGDCSGTSADLYAVASQHISFMMPEGVGMKMSMFRSFDLEIHYDNPTFMSGVADSSGLNVFYSYEPVVHEAGLLQLGDPAILTYDEVAEGYSSFHYDCPSSWLNSWSDPEVTVFAEMFHMHAIGFRMNTTQWAADGSVKREAAVDFWQFGSQQANHVEPYTIAKTDSITTTCSYYQKEGKGGVKFGLDSDQEMCIDFIMYYPFQPIIQGVYCGLAVGGSFPTVDKVEDAAAFDRSFGKSCFPQTSNPSTGSSGAAIGGFTVSAIGAITMLATFLTIGLIGL